MATGEERPQVFYIPGNYEDAGGVFGGRLQTRNAIEFCLFCGPIAYLEYKLLDFGAQTNIIIACITLIPLAALCIFGIGGESLSQILIAFIRFQRKKRELHYDSFTAPGKEESTSFSVDKLLDNMAAAGFLTAIKKAREQSRLDREAREQEQAESERKRRLLRRGKAGQEEERIAMEERRRQEQAIGPQTRRWIGFARHEQKKTDFSRGKMK